MNQGQEILRSSKTLLVLVSAAHATIHMYGALLPLTFPFVIQELGVNYTLIGAMMSVTAVVGGVLQFFVGYVNRYVSGRLLIGLGNLLLGLSTALGGMASSFAQYSWARWMAAVVTSPQHPVGNSLIADNVSQELRGLALSINFAAGNAGTLIVPITASLLMAAVGWRHTMFVFAVPSLIIGLSIIVMARRPAAIHEQGNQSRASLKSLIVETRNLFGNRTVAFLMAASLVAAGGRGMGIVLNFFPSFLGDPTKGLGLPAGMVGLLYTTLLVGSVFGPICLGWISDRLHTRKPMVIVAYLFSAMGALVFAYFKNQSWFLPVVILVFGFMVFSESPLIQSFMSDVSRRGSKDIMFGTYFALAYGVSSLWMVFQGWLVDHYGFAAMFVAMAISYIVAAVLIFQIQEESKQLIEGSQAR